VRPKHWLWIVGLTLLSCCGLGVWFWETYLAYPQYVAISPTDRSRIASALADFDLIVPPEATPVSASQYLWARDGDSGGVRLTFRLPNTRTPEQWLEEIARLNGLKRSASENMHFRSASGDVGCSFDPSTGLYEIWFST
jgi:hypothetical protein